MVQNPSKTKIPKLHGVAAEESKGPKKDKFAHVKSSVGAIMNSRP